MVYVVDAGDKTILAATLDGSKVVTLIATSLEQPYDVVVDPQSGYGGSGFQFLETICNISYS